MPHELTENQKNLKCRLLLFYATTTNHFSSRLWHVTESGFYRTTSDNQFTKVQSKSQSQTCNKKRSWSLFGGVWFTTAFWIPAKSLYLEVCLANQWDALKLEHLQLALVNRKGPFFSMTTPNHTSHNQHFKSWMNWATKFCLICHTHLASHQMTPTSSSILTTFCWEKCFHSQHDAEILFQEFIKSQSMDFYPTGINKLISC